MKTVAFVPAKGASSRVPNKNTRIFNGEPFFVFTLKKLLRCAFIDEVYIDSEDAEILSVGERLGAIPLPRDPELANNRTDGHQLFYNEVRQVPADLYIQHLCTSPFIKEHTIQRALDILVENTEYDSVVLGQKGKYYHWVDNRPAYPSDRVPNSVDLPTQYTEAMGLYVVRSGVAHRTQRRIGESPKMIFGDPMELIDVNTEGDLSLAHTIGAGLLAEEEKRLRVLARFLSSPIISDILDELKIDGILAPDYRCNLPKTKVFGRARTLHIREVVPSDPPDSIYHALQSYKNVVSNDIIVVKTDLPDFAYFGELNMSLSIRSGAVGAIIGGVTRDTQATASAGFPVFAKGRYCKDIKGRGAVESMNRPIEIDGVVVEPSDLIFADQDGIAVIPRRREIEVLKRAIEIMTAERSIVADVCKEMDVEKLVLKHGFF